MELCCSGWGFTGVRNTLKILLIPIYMMTEHHILLLLTFLNLGNQWCDRHYVTSLPNINPICHLLKIVAFCRHHEKQWKAPNPLVFLPELTHSAHRLGMWGGFTYLNHLVNWFYMLLSPFHSIFLSPLHLDPLGRHFILAYYSSFHMTRDLSDLFNDSLIPLNQSYLCNSGRDWNVSERGKQE